MRFRFEPTVEQRTALRAQLARFQEPGFVLAMLHSSLPAGFDPTSVACTLQRAHSDRFVMRVRLRSRAGEERAYALKAYADDFGRHVWAHCRVLAPHYWSDHDGPCLPIRYLPHHRVLVFPWLDGLPLSKIVDERKPELLRRAATLAADLHRLPVASEKPTTAQMIVDDARVRYDRLRVRWPETKPVVEPVMAALGDAVAGLDPAEPAPVHGDLAAGQFLWTGDRLVLLDLDMFGSADPASDAGHFLGQLERRCLSDTTLPAHAARWIDCFREPYLAAMPQVSPRNVSFYHGLTLVRKIYTICRREAPDAPRLVPLLAAEARAALETVVSSEQPG
jgi:tRNA A-37 threonylcarbamoyl transferase component Bud32